MMKDQKIGLRLFSPLRNVLAALFLIGFLSAGSLSLRASAQGTDPFVGTWRWNPAKSHLESQKLTIRQTGANSFSFDAHDGEPAETRIADGKPHVMPGSATVTFEKLDARTWKSTYKGATSSSNIYKVSEDGSRIDRGETIRWADGSEEQRETSFQREGSGKGLAGEWVSSRVEIKAAQKPWDMIIAPGSNGALVVKLPAYGVEYLYRFDGKQYPDPSPNVAKGATFATRRQGQRVMLSEFQVNGKTTESGDFQVSEDGKTMTVHQTTGQQTKPIIYIMERQ